MHDALPLPPDQPGPDAGVGPRPRAGKGGRVKRVLARFLLPLLFAGSALLLVLFFHQDASANPLSRLMTVLALVDDHTLKADRWKDAVVDRAVINGHTYSDKAPLSSFVVVPFYAGWKAMNRDANSSMRDNAALHIGNFVAAGLPFVVVGLLLLSQLRRLGTWRASWIALFAMFSTCLVQYGNAYYGHLLAGSLLLGSYVLAVEKGRPAWAGLLGGLGVLTEYPIFLPEACIGLWLLGPGLSGWRRVLRFALGALPTALALMAYNWALSGHPLSLSYSHVTDDWAPMRIAFGMRLPDANAAYELAFGQFRGALFWAPTLVLLVPLALRKSYNPGGEAKRLRRLLLLLTLTTFALVSSYFKWDGGWCTGPRHLVPVITLLLYVGAGRLARDWRLYRWPFLGLGLLGIFVNLAAAATSPVLPEEHKHPLFDKFLPAIARSELNGHNLVSEYLRWPARWWFLLIWAGLFVLLLGVLRVAAGLTDRWAQADR